MAHDLPPDDRLLSIDEAAHRLHVSSKTVRRWIAAGDLKSYRAGARLIRLHADQVETLLRPVPVVARSAPVRSLTAHASPRPRPVHLTPISEGGTAR